MGGGEVAERLVDGMGDNWRYPTTRSTIGSGKCAVVRVRGRMSLSGQVHVCHCACVSTASGHVYYLPTQVRYAACVSTRSFLEWIGGPEEREPLLPVLLPPMCLNRCVLAGHEIQRYTVGKRRVSIAGPRHSDGLLGLRHLCFSVCLRPQLIVNDSTGHGRTARGVRPSCVASPQRRRWGQSNLLICSRRGTTG